MTASELKALHLSREPDSHFWDRKTMRFFGDSMANFGVRRVEHADGPAWQLYRRRPVRHGLQASHYFTLDGKHL
jgi:hypothetical protein